MPNLLEKSSPASGLSPTQVLQSRHRWERWRGILVALLLGLGATLAALLFLHPSVHLKVLAAVWIGGFFLTLIAAIVAWRFAPASLKDTAQNIDRKLSAKNRLEAMAALHGSASPLAKAQRDETADYLQHEPRARPVRALPWLVGGVVALVLVHFVLMGVWVNTALRRPPVPNPPPPPKEIPHASIVWKSPEPETKANPIEEVPTVAVAQSSSGLKDLTLEVSVNGTPQKSQPLPIQPFDKPGKNTIKVSLYMDELGVQPFDVVSYYLRGQRIADGKLPETTSAIQFIQVRPFRDDVGQERGSTAEANKNLNLLLELKLAELKSLKENFIIAHTDLAVTDPVRVKENERVGKNQGDLSAKTEEVIQAFIQTGYPADMIDLLQQAETPMTDASKKILATQNVAAVPFQEKALNLIVEVEKFFHKVLADGKGPPPPKGPDDPFKDKQQHELKKRFETEAGQLEQLAKNQAKLAKDINDGNSPDSGQPSPADNSGDKNNAQPTPGAASGDSAKPVPLPTPQSVDPFAPNADKGTFAERQARVLQGIETLLGTNDVLPPTVNQALKDAQKHATESTHQLDQVNDAGAREPAALAAQDLQNAVTEMNNAGEKAAQLAMEQAQQQLNGAAKQLKDLAKNGSPDSQQQSLSDVAAKVQDVQKQAGDDADQQQESGSAKGAERLANLANQIANQHIAQDLGYMAQKGLDVNQAGLIAQKLETLAGQAAQGMAGDKPSAQEIARLISSLETSRANLARLAEKAGATDADTSGQHPSSDQHGAGQNQQGANDQGQTPGQGQRPQPGQDQSQGSQPGGTTSGSTAPGSNPGGNAPGGSGEGANGMSDRASKAYHETMADVQNEVQQAAVVVPQTDTQDLQQKLDDIQGHNLGPQKVQPINMVNAYQVISAPLDKLIQDLTALVAQTQRQDLIKQPDLDEAPPAYRPAVSDYFENMSRDYHPDNADDNAKKP